MILSIPVLDRKLRSYSVASATKTFAKSKGAQSGARSKKASPRFADPNNGNGD